MRIYIAGRIKGSNNYERQFENAEMWLRLRGYKVINPVKVRKSLAQDLSDEQFIGVELTLLGLCDEIFMLNGWQDSKECSLMLDTAKATGKTPRYQGYFERGKNG